MLKIKDDVPLEKLKEYGFTANPIDRTYGKGRLFDQYIEIQEDRIIAIYTADDRGIDEDTVYDLIQAGLVEKVRE